MNGRAQWETNQATLLGEKRVSLEGWEWSGQVPSLLAERARYECARSMHAVEGSLGHSPQEKFRELEEHISRCAGGKPPGLLV
jgi:hypothetical protein